jgi:CheY-like chemotaxis protein
MVEEKKLANEVAAGGYDAAEKPFDFIGTGSETALICESDPAIKEKIATAVKSLGYHVTEASAAREALKNMRFHMYDLIIVNENFDAVECPGSNDVLIYLQNLVASTRRNIFVALLSDKYRTTDNMMAFNKSVNLVINTKNIDDFSTIIKRGLDDNLAFYSIFKETLKKLGRV